MNGLSYPLCGPGEVADFSAAVDWHLERSPSPDGVWLIRFFHDIWNRYENRHLDTHRVSRILAYLDTAIAEGDSDCVHWAASTAASLAKEGQNFAAASRYMRVAFGSLKSINGLKGFEKASNLANVLYEFVLALHHTANDALFDETAAFALTVDLSDGSEMRHLGFQADVRFLIAESYLARRCYDEALTAHDEAYPFNERLLAVGNCGASPLASVWYQRANILNGLGRTAEAKDFYNRALEESEELAKADSQHNHGVAACLRNLAGIARTEGRFGEAKSNLRRAQELFEQVGDPAAVASCWMALGDVHRDKGEFAEAERLYCAALTFWREQEHPRWIATIEERLQELSDVRAATAEKED